MWSTTHETTSYLHIGNDENPVASTCLLPWGVQFVIRTRLTTRFRFHAIHIFCGMLQDFEPLSDKIHKWLPSKDFVFVENVKMEGRVMTTFRSHFSWTPKFLGNWTKTTEMARNVTILSLRRTSADRETNHSCIQRVLFVETKKYLVSNEPSIFLHNTIETKSTTNVRNNNT